MKSLQFAYPNGTSFPVAQIAIGIELPWSSKGDMCIKSVDISMGVGNESSSCIVVLSKPTHNFAHGVFMEGTESNTVKQGEMISVYLGYYSRIGLPVTPEAFSGFISKVKIVYESEYTNVIIECLDAKMWMMPGCKFEKKLPNRYSTIVNTVLPTYTGKVRGFFVQIEGEPTLGSPVYQTNESDYEFLCRLAKTTGCFFYMYCGTAYFVSPTARKSLGGLTISPCDYVKRISWASDVLGIPSEVSVQGTDIQKPKAPAESMDVKVNLKSIGQGLPASMAAKNISGEGTKKEITDSKADDTTMAQFLAQAEFTTKSINFVKCVVTVSGYTDLPTDLSLGIGVTVSGYGVRLSNTYILTGIKHKFNGIKKEFTTDLELSTDRVLSL